MRPAHPIFLAATLLLGPSALAAQDMVLDTVESLLRAGAGWRATQLLQPRLSTVSTRTPAVRIAGARAAEQWQGWSSVWSLLHGQDWLDTKFDRLGHRLLAEAALARNNNAEALDHARLAMKRTVYPRTAEEEARRWIVLARAHQRDNALDSASAAYTQAAALFPVISDWLALRAAGATSDSATRSRLYTTITNPAAKQRIVWTEAGALDRLGMKDEAARKYAQVGDLGTSLRLRWEATADSRVRAAITREALAVIERGNPRNEISQVLDLIESYRLPMTAGESLMVAHSSVTRRSAYAIRLFQALNSGSPLSASDRMAWGNALAARGDWGRAAGIYKGIKSGPEAGRAAYYAARADLRNNKFSSATRQLQQIPSKFADDVFAASTALYLLADLALDASRPDSARKLLRTLADKYPTGEFAPRAALIAPLISFAEGDFKTSQRELSQALTAGVLTGFNGDAGRYWLARSNEKLGDKRGATSEYQSLLANWPDNYYAIRAAERLDTIPFYYGTGMSNAPAPPIPGELARAELLQQLGLDFEAGLELDSFGGDAESGEELSAAGEALVRAGHPSRARRFAQRAVAAGVSPERIWEVMYPLPFKASLIGSASAANLDPWLVAAVIKQESWFEPTATSPAGARGLMQIMPSVGEELARQAGISGYDDALLWQPEVSLGLGTKHLAVAMKRYPEIERALGAYNAGGTRMNNWSKTLLDGGSAQNGPIPDIELFVERIPYLETRGYIRNIVVNETMYRYLYGRTVR